MERSDEQPTLLSEMPARCSPVKLGDFRRSTSASSVVIGSVRQVWDNFRGSIENLREELLQKGAKAAAEVEYPAYGVTGPGPSSELSRPSVSNMTSPKGQPGSSAVAKVVGDRKLAQSAHMFHYQHQKQHVIAMERHAQSGRHGSASGGESEEETEEGDYTVYECPGLAPTGEMEVKNPLFLDDPTPASPANFRHQDR